MDEVGVDPFACDPNEVDWELRRVRTKGEQSRRINGRLRFKGMKADRNAAWITDPRNEKHVWLRPGVPKARRRKTYTVRQVKAVGPIITMENMRRGKVI